MTDRTTDERVTAHGGAGDQADVTSATLRHARAVAVLTAAEQAYRNVPNDAFADATLRASEEVIAARVDLCHVLARRGWAPNPGHTAIDELIVSAWVGITGG